MRLHPRHLLLGFLALALAAPSLAKEEPEATTVVCKDGSTSKGGRGACRGHGGVDKAATAKAGGAAAPAAAGAGGEKAKEAAEKKEPKQKTEAKTEATVVCKDGSTSQGGRGACRGHGGVDKAATAKGGAATPAIPAAPAAAATPATPAPTAPPPRATPAAPAASQRAAPADDKKGPPEARCKDGTFSYAKHHTGACARHGGVAEWLDKTEKK